MKRRKIKGQREVLACLHLRVTRCPRFLGGVPVLGDLSPANAVPGNVPNLNVA